MASYTVRTSDGCGFVMEYDPSDPASPIRFYVGPGDEAKWWRSSPSQAWQARDAWHAAELVQEYFDDQAGVDSVERQPVRKEMGKR